MKNAFPVMLLKSSYVSFVFTFFLLFRLRFPAFCFDIYIYICISFSCYFFCFLCLASTLAILRECPIEISTVFAG